jgi:hypothetical protein
MGSEIEFDDLVGNVDGAREAVSISGSGHYRNWLISALTAKYVLRDAIAVDVDLDRYRTIQAFERSRKEGFLASLSWPEILTRNQASNALSLALMKVRFTALKFLDRMNMLPRHLVTRRRMRDLRIYYSSNAENFDIGAHQDIMDAFRWLKGRRS